MAPRTRMIAFAPGPLPIDAAHLRYLLDHFIAHGLEHRVVNENEGAASIRAGDAYVSCSTGDLFDALPDAGADVFRVLLPHNLTGIKGVQFATAHADLKILPGEQVAHVQRLNPEDQDVVIGGYAKWDTIYRERFLVSERRSAIASEKGIDPEATWVCFYPTGPSRIIRGRHDVALPIYDRLRRDLGAVELFFCSHANNLRHPATLAALAAFERAAASRGSLHMVDGGDSLGLLAACDLFVTDIASPVLSAISMNKPVAFIEADARGASPWIRSEIAKFQSGPFLRKVRDVRELLDAGGPPPSLRRLLRRCVRFDDDRNCERIAGIISERYCGWLSRRSAAGPAA